MIKIIKQDKDSRILIVSPLLTGHTISNETFHSIKSNTIPYTWITSEGPFKHARNVQEGINEYKTIYDSLPPYLQILDRDIILERKFLDRMYEVLHKSADNVAFSYCGFSYRGHINVTFQPRPYSIQQLMKGNYISSNSLYKNDVIEKVGGFVVEEKYHRLSDWCMFRKLYKHGYIGICCYKTGFIAMSTKDDISAGGNEEYQQTYKLVMKDFTLNPTKRW